MGPGITSSRVELFISPLAPWPCLPHGERRADCKAVPGTNGNPEQTDVQAEKQLAGELSFQEQTWSQLGSCPHFLVSVVRML